MQCQYAHELFSDYLTGDLDRALEVSFENHLTTCSTCREELAGVRRVWQDLDRMPVVEPPPLFHANLMERLDAAREATQVKEERRRALWDWRALFRPRALALAATLLIFGLASVEYVQTQRAELGPISALLHWLHPGSVASQPKLLTPDAVWVPGSGTGGALLVRVQAEPAGAHRSGSVSYLVVVRKRIAGVPPEQGPVVARSSKDSLSAGEMRTVTLHLDEMPTPDTEAISVEVIQGDAQSDQGQNSKDIPVVLRPSSGGQTEPASTP